MVLLAHRNIILERWFVPSCFVMYIALRVALLVSIPIDQHSDALWYFNRGVGIAMGEGYSERGIPTAYWPVGWPGVLGLLFSIFGPFPIVGQIANIAFSAAIFILTLHLGSNI